MNDNSADELSEPEPLRRSRLAGAILWPSFFSAAIATMCTFAFIDPLTLRDATFPDLPLSRELGYSLGFFLFWLCTAASSLFTYLLLSPGSRFNAPLRDE